MNLVDTFYLFWLIGLTLVVLDHHDIYRQSRGDARLLSGMIDESMKRFARWQKLDSNGGVKKTE